MDMRFFINSILLGVGLAMDAFSVSCANAIREPRMGHLRMTMIAGVYAAFQFLMPMTGWLCVHTIRETFTAFQPFIPWIALVLLLGIGGKMLLDGIRTCRGIPGDEGREIGKEIAVLSFGVLILQGIATSIDALSVGFMTAGYAMHMAVISSLIIGAVTFAICMGGLLIGRKAGSMLTGRGDILGGVILIAIGILNVLHIRC